VTKKERGKNVREVPFKKTCSLCKQEKNIADFMVDTSHKDGLRCECKECHNKKKREARRLNPERFRFKQRKSYQKNCTSIKKRIQAVRTKCLEHYGKACTICNSTKNLAVDHINGKGLNSPKFGLQLWKWLIENHFPNSFRTLCVRCNNLDGAIRKHPTLGISGIDEVIELLKYKESYERTA
jgi:hypothetical protein